MSTIKVSTISPLGTDATKTITIGNASNGDVAAGVFTNVPAFFAQLSADQSVTDATSTKAQIDQVIFDSNNCYDNTTNYRFTPTVAGKYFIYGTIQANGSANSALDFVMSIIAKNGTNISQNLIDNRDNRGGTSSASYTSVITDLNGTTDYIELFGIHNVSSGNAGFDGNSTTARTYLGAYRIIGA